MEMLPPPNFWSVPAEVRRIDCTPERPCVVNTIEDHAHGHPEHVEPPTPRNYSIQPGTGSLQINGQPVRLG